MGTLALISLGSNLGDRKGYLTAALAALGKLAGVVVRDVSRYHETTPVGGPGGQGAFLNAAAALETTLDPLDLLHALQAIEEQSGRVRRVRWEERSLDLDLLLFGDRIISTPPVSHRVFGGPPRSELRVPHPWMALRRFVLKPLAEVAPGSVDPLTGRTVAELLANLDRRPSYVALSDLMRWELRDEVYRRLVAELSAVELSPRTEPLPFSRAWYLQAEKRHEGSETTFDDWLERHARRFISDSDSAALSGDRWLVSNTWFDEVCEAAVPFVPMSRWAIFRSRFLEARGRMMVPTFVVVSKGSTTDRRHGDFPDRPHWFTPLGEVPILETDSDDPGEVVSEILAACAASRAG